MHNTNHHIALSKPFCLTAFGQNIMAFYVNTTNEICRPRLCPCFSRLCGVTCSMNCQVKIENVTCLTGGTPMENDSSWNHIIDTRYLLKSCLQPALAQLQDPPEKVERTTTRLHLLVELFNDMDDDGTFVFGM